MKLYTKKVKNCRECPNSTWMNVNRTDLSCRKYNRKVHLHLPTGMKSVMDLRSDIDTYIPVWCGLEDA